MIGSLTELTFEQAEGWLQLERPRGPQSLRLDQPTLRLGRLCAPLDAVILWFELGRYKLLLLDGEMYAWSFVGIEILEDVGLPDEFIVEHVITPMRKALLRVRDG